MSQGIYWVYTNGFSFRKSNKGFYGCGILIGLQKVFATVVPDILHKKFDHFEQEGFKQIFCVLSQR